MKAFFLRKLLVNKRTVLFCVFAAGAISVPIAFLLRSIGYQPPPVSCIQPDPILMVNLLSLISPFLLPVVSLSLFRQERVLAVLGLLLSPIGLFGLFLYREYGV